MNVLNHPRFQMMSKGLLPVLLKIFSLGLVVYIQKFCRGNGGKRGGKGHHILQQ
jgi:hypothetical protein